MPRPPGAGGEHLPAGLAAARAEVDHPVGAGDHVHVVLDQDHGVAGVDQQVQLAQQQGDVGRVQPRGRLVQQVEGAAAPDPLQLGRQLDPLRLAAGQLGRRLAEPQVAQAHVAQRRQAAGRARQVGEEAARLVTVIASTSAMLRPR